MNEKRPIVKVDLEPLGIVLSFVIVGIILGLFFLARGISERSATAYLILGGLVTLAILSVGVGLTIGIIWFANRITERRELREQARFVDNAKENLAIMQMTARTQSTQNAMLLRQAREAQRQIPAPEGNEDIDALVFDDAVFDELDG
jgi:uncharacterized protein YneF (UPF0154 family)